jgi:hypothetical protein
MAAGDCGSISAKQQRLKSCPKFRVLCQVFLVQGPCFLVLLAPSSHVAGAQRIIYLREPIKGAEIVPRTSTLLALGTLFPSADMESISANNYKAVPFQDSL